MLLRLLAEVHAQQPLVSLPIGVVEDLANFDGASGGFELAFEQQVKALGDVREASQSERRAET